MEHQRKRRTKIDIIAQILKVAIKPKLKTHIMYEAELSFYQVNTYLGRTIDCNLLEKVEDKPRPRYKTTGKGERYLTAHREMMSLFQ